MMQHKLLGVPLVIWGVVCLGLAVLWAVVWPSAKLAVDHGPRFLILRWGHALVWLLLATAALIAGVLGPAQNDLALWFARAAAAAYLVFIITVVTSK